LKILVSLLYCLDESIKFLEQEETKVKPSKKAAITELKGIITEHRQKIIADFKSNPSSIDENYAAKSRQRVIDIIIEKSNQVNNHEGKFGKIIEKLIEFIC